MTFSDWLSVYMTLYKRNLAPKTRESYDRLQGLLAPFLGALDLASVSPDAIQAALNQIAEENGSRQAQLAFALIHAALARAVRSRHLPFNPADAVDKPPHDGTKGKSISEDDWTLLEPVIDSDIAFALMARAGLRRGELLALRWGDVDLASRQIKVCKQLVRVNGQIKPTATKSRAGMRCVPIEPQLLQILRRDFKLSPAARIVPCSPETLARRWRRAQLEAGIQQPYRLHDLRHTYATRLVAAGCSLPILQYMIGHSSYQLTVSTYTHIEPKHAVSELDRISAALH